MFWTLLARLLFVAAVLGMLVAWYFTAILTHALVTSPHDIDSTRMWGNPRILGMSLFALAWLNALGLTIIVVLSVVEYFFPKPGEKYSLKTDFHEMLADAKWFITTLVSVLPRCAFWCASTGVAVYCWYMFVFIVGTVLTGEHEFTSRRYWGNPRWLGVLLFTEIMFFMVVSTLVSLKMVLNTFRRSSV